MHNSSVPRALLALLAACSTAVYAGDAALLREVRGIVAEKFYRPEVRERIRALPDAHCAAAGCDAEIAGELAALNASHTGRYTADRIDYFELLDIYGGFSFPDRLAKLFPPDGKVHYAGIGIAPRRIDGRNFVAAVYDGSPAAAAGIRTGDELLEVDGKPYEEIASFRGKAGRDVALKLRRERDAQPVELKVAVIDIRPSETLLAATRASARVIERGGRKIGYLRLWAFTREEVTALIGQTLGAGPLAAVDALVLDLRCRWGGAPPDAGELFVGRTPNVEWTNPDGTRFIANFRWRKPVVAVIDGRTRSGMEFLALSLRKGGMPLVGARTAGALLGAQATLLSDDSLLMLAVVEPRIDGEVLEGHGVAPTIAVESPLPWSQGHDAALARAIEEAARLPEVSPAAAPSA